MNLTDEQIKSIVVKAIQNYLNKKLCAMLMILI